MPRAAFLVAAILLLPAVAACNRKPAESVEALDKDLVGAAGKDRIATAGNLGKEIVVDPAVAAGAAPRPAAAPPETASRPAAAAPAGRECAFAYDVAWARRLPAELPIYPNARVMEAAGSDAPGCRRRIVSFTTAAPVSRVIDFYRGRVTHAGYSAEQLSQEGKDVLGGTRGDAAYYITASPSGTGATVDLVSNGG